MERPIHSEITITFERGTTKMLSSLRILLAIFLLSLLTACFHTSSDSENAPGVPTHISGLASKGLILHGVIKAFATKDGNIVRSPPIAEATTDEKGHYSLNIQGYNGPLLIQVSPAPDGSTRMLCDAQAGCTDWGSPVNFGETMSLNFTMEAVIPNVNEGQTVRASITPLSTMAAAYTRKLGVTSASATLGIQKVEALFELQDLLGTLPTDLTNSTKVNSEVNSEALKIAALLAAIANIANSYFSGSIATAIEYLVTDFAERDGELVARESVNNPYTISFKELAEAALVEANAAGVNNSSFAAKAIIALSTEAAAYVADDETNNAEEVQPVEMGDIAKAKAIVAQMTTWASSLSDIQNGAKQFEDEVIIAEGVAGDVFPQVQDGMAYGIAALFEGFGVVKKTGATNGQRTILEILENHTDYFQPYGWDPIGLQPFFRSPEGISGNVTVTGNRVSISNGMINGASVNLSFDFPVSFVGSNFVAKFTEGVENTVEAEKAKISINAGSASAQFSTTVDIVNDYNDPDSPLPPLTSIKLDLGVAMGHVNVEHGVSFSGSLGFELTITNENTATLTLNPKNIYLSGSFGNDNHSFAADFDFNMRNYASFRPATPAHQLGDVDVIGSYSFSSGGNTFSLALANSESTYTFTPATSSGLSNKIKVSRSDKYFGDYSYNIYTYEESLTNWLNSLESRAWLPYTSTVDGVGTYTIIYPEVWLNSGTISGTLSRLEDDSDEDSTHWRDFDGVLTFEANMKLPNGDPLPPVMLTLGMDRTGYETMSASATFEYDNYSVSMQISTDKANPQNNQTSISIESADVGKLTIYPDRDSDGFAGSVKVGSNIVGRISTVRFVSVPTLRIDYVNGEFDLIPLGSS